MTLSSAQEIINDIRQGKMVILMDDENRENEGDLIIASEMITPEAINFMATHGRGLICLTLTKDRCKTLNLPLMVQNNHDKFSTAFTVSIEAATDVTTGISASDRAKTVQAAVAPNASADNIVSPGHIFPLMAQDGGVLIRAGHTEAGCDVARLAGLEASSVIVEILNEDGTMARRPQLEVFAQKHNLKLGTIADLIEYRTQLESHIERLSESELCTEYGVFNLITYRDTIDNQLHYALCKGDINPDTETLVRVHVKDTLKDILHTGATQWSLQAAMQRIQADGGVLVIISQIEPSTMIINQVNQLASEHQAIAPLPTTPQSRQIGLGSQILSELGLRKIRLLSSQNQQYRSLSGFDLEVVEYICN
ncbi:MULTISPECIES: bifunctional 3,4-dihydroxy-2-butanone-4-phosphate synthase/GTP cyclohydrolase II [unclassified Photobacterium]|uniref:bifunctional 3,4-dihydroxy-2-butanone-4-phosphate synthase/GTP cyclohydrolase II n=1 Tax=unclassified Photobacterium TaxID=2628852 RepID=UPI000D170B0E|nr:MULTISPECIES: bifunctional 3,4-dihydroxy-2-butanone-4-phosphate synthase/GTP cyclohydrolase II [unclassified Photobacterium]PSV26349.1 3,4-dihydroxy-2-butanone-4-phosphate synthase [Photobacterium sp. GB-56]PSV31536.1 3,4-dihydroxy-2-butanone-4-phosphate synthase [Photobacterium sp. GB-72]PSV33796.1 3,4-dihydroxy-2-butanone-4-phosphate synthase [Photobacterium sp. GB-27]PSV36823.1 3,4-dihydroxy-2-butanone-4-phosphate synthase [Photobacterium sp. GB-210]PSV46074.1 3,4-dihydroxy-2-butanone-4-